MSDVAYQTSYAGYREIRGRQMPMKSQAQRKLMWATVNGADTGVPKSVAKEFTQADKGGKLPKKKRNRASTAMDRVKGY